MAQITLNSSGVASSGALVLQSNGTTTAVTISTGQVATLEKDAVVNGLTVGRGAGAVATNTAVGASALAANQAGGTNNTAIGNAALDANTTGDANTAVGNDALGANTTSSNNTAVGYQAAYSSSTVSALTAVGYQAGYSNTSGALDAFGFEALKANTTGLYNSAVGVLALQANTTGSSNVALGRESLQANTTASNNTAVGYQAGYSTTTGAANAFIGAYSGYATTGASNTFVGISAGEGVTSGAKNTIIGRYNGNQGGLDIRTTSNYIVLSDGDGNPRQFINGAGSQTYFRNTANAGAGIVIVGQPSGGSSYGALSLGAAYNAANSKDVGLFLENNSGQRIYVQNITAGVYLADGGTSWTSNSDERLKENLVPITDAANKVASLRAVTGNYIADEDKKSRSFLIAQDIQAVLPEAVDATDSEKLGVQYTDVIPLLVAAIKELKAEIDALKGA
jgi:hypothetical protein